MSIMWLWLCPGMPPLLEAHPCVVLAVFSVSKLFISGRFNNNQIVFPVTFWPQCLFLSPTFLAQRQWCYPISSFFVGRGYKKKFSKVFLIHKISKITTVICNSNFFLGMVFQVSQYLSPSRRGMKKTPEYMLALYFCLNWNNPKVIHW